jgi:hypothetical protein
MWDNCHGGWLSAFCVRDAANITGYPARLRYTAEVTRSLSVEEQKRLEEERLRVERRAERKVKLEDGRGLRDALQQSVAEAKEKVARHEGDLYQWKEQCTQAEETLAVNKAREAVLEQEVTASQAELDRLDEEQNADDQSTVKELGKISSPRTVQRISVVHRQCQALVDKLGSLPSATAQSQELPAPVVEHPAQAPVPQRALKEKLSNPGIRRAKFVKNMPIAVYPLNEQSLASMPPTILAEMGSLDKGTYGPHGNKDAFLKTNFGGAMALQVAHGKLDAYPIPAEQYTSKYKAVSLEEMQTKNPKNATALSEILGDLSNIPGACGALKTVPTEMVLASDLGFPLENLLKIEAPWGGDQTKDAGKDAYLVACDAPYLVNLDELGLPVAYIMAADAQKVVEAEPVVEEDEAAAEMEPEINQGAWLRWRLLFAKALEGHGRIPKEACVTVGCFLRHPRVQPSKTALFQAFDDVVVVAHECPLAHDSATRKQHSTLIDTQAGQAVSTRIKAAFSYCKGVWQHLLLCHHDILANVSTAQSHHWCLDRSVRQHVG